METVEIMEDSVPSKLTPRQKAAMLIRMFDKDTSQQVVKFLNQDEKEILINEIALINDFEKKDMLNVMQEFLFYFKSRNIGLMGNGVEFVKELFKDIPEKDLERMLGRVYFDMENPFAFLDKINQLEPLVTLLNEEEPQTIAVVANFLEAKASADLLKALPEDKMMETIIGIAKLDQIDNELLGKMSSYLSKKMDSMALGEQNKPEGIKTIVNILNNVPRGVEKIVFERLEQIDPVLCEAIRENMFVFDDLVKLDNMTLQKVLAEVQDIQTLAKAMKLAKEELKEKLLQNMSEGRRDMVTQELESMPPMKVSDAEKAQQTIASIVKELEKAGKIEIQRGEEDVIM